MKGYKTKEDFLSDLVEEQTDTITRLNAKVQEQESRIAQLEEWLDEANNKVYRTQQFLEALHMTEDKNE
jgi:uncharacterized coiled-coil protein SlyX